MDSAILIINTVAIIFIPIVAIVVAQYLQDRAAKRKDKIDIFKTLVACNVYGWGNSYRSVDALNSIPIIFADDKIVIEQYNKYYDSCKNGTEQDIPTNKIKLLEMMSKSLGYKNGWEVFQRPYLPTGLHDEMLKEQKYKDCFLDFVNTMDRFISVINTQQPQQIMQEKKEADK